MIFLQTKKRTVIAAAAIAAAVMAFVAACIIAASAAPAVSPNGMTVVIDPGHGGRDGGVVGSSTGEKESDINLGIAKSLRHFLREAGYEVVMTRESDVDLATDGEGFKKSDMLARKAIIDEAAPDLVVSVHQNFYPMKDVHGAQVFYAASSSEGREYAERMQSVLNASLDCDREAKSGDYYILQCSSSPSLLVECGFLSNPTDEANLVTAAYQQKVAYAIATGVRSLLESDEAVAAAITGSLG